MWVSHFVSQTWCEQQMEYGFSRPHEVVEAAHMAKGSDLHLARELDTENYVDVAIESNEDIFAIKVINLLQHLTKLPAAEKCREVPIFGWVGKLFLMGKIDELRLNGKGKVEISEFKTRVKAVLPGKAQQNSHKIQVLIYKYLMDNLANLDVDELCKVIQFFN